MFNVQVNSKYLMHEPVFDREWVLVLPFANEIILFTTEVVLVSIGIASALLPVVLRLYGLNLISG